MQEPHNPLTELLNADQKLWQHLPSSFPYILPRIVPLKKDAPSEICYARREATDYCIAGTVMYLQIHMPHLSFFGR